MVLLGVVLAVGFLRIDRAGVLPAWLLDSDWLYNGGSTGARTLLGAVASSAIGVAGTIFSITIASLSLAAGQMGPRLLRNFTRDRGNQVTLGVFLATFAYALMVLRSVRSENEGEFVPHLSLSFGIFLAFVCVATLVYFVNHSARRINVDTVISLVSEDIHAAVRRLTSDEPPSTVTPQRDWSHARPVIDKRRGYVQQLDRDGLADWAHDHKTAIRLLIRPGDFVFPGAPIALMDPPVEHAGDAIRAATALGAQRTDSADLEFAVLQLVEVAVRAMSPGINDPNTAIAALEKLGAVLCDIATRHFPADADVRDGHVVLVVPRVDYDGLTDTMFHMIRQNAAGSAALLIRMLEVLTAVSTCERNPERRRALARHAALVLADAERTVATDADFRDVKDRYRTFEETSRRGLVPALLDADGRRQIAKANAAI